MLGRSKLCSICLAFALSVCLFLTGIQYANNRDYNPSIVTLKTLGNHLKTQDGSGNLFQPLKLKASNDLRDTERILERTRSKIKYDLRNYNFFDSGVHKLEDLLMAFGGKPLRNVVISSWRSGSTFLGEILNAMPGNFYHYEPLLRYGIIRIRGPPVSVEIMNTLKKMLRCDYSGIEDYFEYGKTTDDLFQFSHNKRLWEECKKMENLCFDANFTAHFCKLFPFQSMKLVRVRLRLVKDILEDKEFDAKVVLLVRDPRGIIQSRLHRGFCKTGPDCWEPELLCADMISDYKAAGRFFQEYPGRVMVLRYEELALNPNVTAQQLLKFLRLGYTKSLDEFFQTHTNVNVDLASAGSTFRVSRDVPFKWKKALDLNQIEEIQVACKKAMELWGYQLAYNASHLASKEFYPLKPYSVRRLDD